LNRKAICIVARATFAVRSLAMKTYLIAAVTALFCAPAFAQTALPPLASTTSQAQGGILPLPDGVEKLVAIDAQNAILAQMRPEVGEAPQHRLIQVKHVYVGGIAMLFSGTAIIPTAPFVSPGFAQGNGFGAAPGGNFGFPGGNQGMNQGNGFMFPQNNGFNGQQPNQFTPNTGRTQALRRNQPGLNIGTPVGNFFVPGQTEMR
jgi:hypothetical protein